MQAARSVMSDLRRLATFAGCPLLTSSFVSCVKLANCGFMYAGHSDILVCQRCGVQFSGWLKTRRNPIVEHRCPSPSATTEGLPLSELLRDHHRDSTIYAIYVTVLQRSARNGVLGPVETRDDTLRHRPGQAFTPSPHSDRPTCRGVTPSDDDVTSGNTVTSDDTDDANVLTLKLSLSKRPTSLTGSPPCIWCRWWQWQCMYMGIRPTAPD